MWLLLSAHALDESLHAPAVHFGQVRAAKTRLLAANLVACTLPPDVPVGATGVRLSIRNVSEGDTATPKPISPGCSMRFAVLAPDAQRQCASPSGDEEALLVD